MLSHAGPPAYRIPVFKNILSLKTTPRIPVIPYFTRQQWEMATKGLKHRPLSRPDPDIPRLHYQPAPWGRGDIVVAFKELLENPIILCTPRVKVKRQKDGFILVEMVLECPPPATRVGCKAFLRAFVDHINYDIDPWGCENEGCSGQCQIVLEGAETVGDIYCLCHRIG